MPATITRLRTQTDRLRADQADQLRQLLLDFPELPERACGKIIAAIDQLAPASNEWTFVMISPAQNAAVVSWLRRNSHAALVALDVWSQCFTALRWDTGEIVLTRDELADGAGTAATTVSRIMGELESIGAITRKRERIAGMRGPGMVRYFMNPNVGTHLTGATRDRAQASAPQLQVVEGRKL